jgi:pilus assembly protein FimV
MIITCEKCNTSFNLDAKMIKPTGSKVRCSVCTNVFTAYPSQSPPAEPVTEVMESTSVPPPGAGREAAPAAAAPAPPEVPHGTVQADSDPAAGADLPHEPGDSRDDGAEKGAADVEIEDAVSDALDDDLAGMSFEAESEPDTALSSGTAGTSAESDATMIADLDDDDLNLDFSPEPADEETAAAVIADLEEDDLDLDIPLEVDEGADDTATVITNLDESGLDIDGDFSPELGDAGPSDTSPDDLEGLDLSLEGEKDDEAPTAEALVSQSPENPLDELSLDLDPDTNEETTEAQPPSDKGESAEDDLNLMLDLDDEGVGEAASTEQPSALEDDLDLSGLEDLLKEDEEGEDDTATLIVDEDEASDLLLETEDDGLQAQTDRAAETDDTLEDLEFDLEGDRDAAGAIDTDEAADADQEIDLSEIEKMLEEPEKGGSQFNTVPDQDLDLDIEASLETEKWMSDADDDGRLVKDEELDLSELEQVLEDVDVEEKEDGPEDVELELDLEDAAVSEAPKAGAAADTELDFDLSDFEEDVSPTNSAKATEHEPADMALEFEVEEASQPEQMLEDEGLEETVAIPEPKEEKAAAKPPAPTEVGAGTARAKRAKKGVSKSLVFFLVVVIFGGLAYGTYYLLNQNGIEIPFLSDYMKPKVNDPGNLKLTTYDINSRFVDNANVGKLFVITGKVKNGYSESRGMITLMGKIYSTGKVPVQKEKVYCGNVMSDLELANLGWDKIQSRLANRLGDNRSNVKIGPGKSIPFMVVFSKLPSDLEEFTIEVTGSTALK